MKNLLSKLPLPAFLKRRRPRVMVIRLAGVIGQAGAMRKGLTLDSLSEAIAKAFASEKTAAVALQINSPGGSPVQSSLIQRRIRQLADEKNIPVYAFAEDVAASGGYWLAMAADEFYADAGSIVGSIGVVSVLRKPSPNWVSSAGCTPRAPARQCWTRSRRNVRQM